VAKRSAPAPIHPFDKLHGTDTSGLLPGQFIATGTEHPPEELTAYYAIAPSILASLLDTWLQRTAPAPIEQTVFYDVGAGKGRAMLLASQFPFLRIEGVELNQQLAQIAAANIHIWERDQTAEVLSPLLLHHADATTQPLPNAPTCVFLFHPFEERLLRRFLQHIETSLTRQPHPLDLLYANSEHDSPLDRHPAFKKIWDGRVAMSTEDHIADLAAIEQQKEYGSTGDEACTIYRFVGRVRHLTR
jgi:hypothetical protein